MDHLCEFVTDGDELVRTYFQLVESGKRVELIITDFMMPRLNGLQAIQKINMVLKERSEGSGLKVKPPRFFVVSAYMHDSIEEKLRQEGAKTVMSKPISLEVLREVLSAP